MKGKAMLLIAVMMISPVAAILSMGTASGGSTLAASFSLDVVKTKPGHFVFTLTVTNESTADEKITQVKLIAPLTPAAVENLGAVGTVPKDNEVAMGGLTENDNRVLLKAGTIIQLKSTAVVKITEDTVIEIKKGTDVRRFVAGTLDPEPAYAPIDLTDNLEVKITNDNLNYESGDLTDNGLDNFTFTLGSENSISWAEDKALVTNNAVAVLVEDTWVIRDGISVMLADDTKIRLKVPANAYLGADNTLRTENRVTVTVGADNMIDPAATPVDNVGRVFIANEALGSIEKGDNILIDDGAVDEIVIPKDTEVVLVADEGWVLLIDNTIELIREARENILLDPAVVIENVPAKWQEAVTGTEAGGEWYIEWVAQGGYAQTENAIPPGESENFPFAVSMPPVAGDYKFSVKVRDSTGAWQTYYDVLTVTVDPKKPTIDVEVSPNWVKDNVEVTIKVTTDETVSIENVFVAENNVENVPIQMTPDAENKVWEGKYTTTDNENRDGYVWIYVVGVKDEVGNENEAIVNRKLLIDRHAPPAPNLAALGLPWNRENDVVDNDGEFEGSPDVISPTNFENDYIILEAGVENIAPDHVDYPLEGLKLQILVDDNVYAEATTDRYGDLSYSFELPEGRYKISARFVDRVGNIGEENKPGENVIVDTQPPDIDIELTPEPVDGYIRENKISVKVTLSDAVLGIENMEYHDNIYLGENRCIGYRVEMYWFDTGVDNFVWIYDLVPDNTHPVKVSNLPENDPFGTTETGPFTFENIYAYDDPLYPGPEDGLRPGKWMIRVIVGDNLRRAIENLIFTIDVEPPATPELVTDYPDTTVETPMKTRTKAWAIRGEAGAAEPGATITIYGTTYAYVEGAWTLDKKDENLGSDVVADDGSYDVLIKIDKYEGKVVTIEVDVTDKAGNPVLRRALFGHFLYDARVPKVEMAIETKTIPWDQSGIVISGSIDIDDWETFADITVTVSPAAASLRYNTEDGTFTVSVPVAEGEQKIVAVTAMDPVGNQGSDYATISRETKPVEVPVPYATYAIVIVIIALILAAIAIFRRT